jgi:hypothetical protein
MAELGSGQVPDDGHSNSFNTILSSFYHVYFALEQGLENSPPKHDKKGFKQIHCSHRVNLPDLQRVLCECKCALDAKLFRVHFEHALHLPLRDCIQECLGNEEVPLSRTRDLIN